MKIYTRTGDDGSTQGPRDKRIRKSDVRATAFGDIDELNCQLGLCLHACPASGATAECLKEIQRELFSIGALLAWPMGKPPPEALADDGSVARMEQQIDRIMRGLGELENFIIPGGCELACRLHVARALCRRAERAVVAVVDAGAHAPPVVLRYLNRLSDLLFVLARAANAAAGAAEQTWQP